MGLQKSGNPLAMFLASVGIQKQETVTAPEPAAAPVQTSDAPYVVGIDLGGTQIRAAVLQGATIVARARRQTPAIEGPTRVIAAIADTVHEVMQLAEVGPRDLRGIGIGTPGPINPRTGMVYQAPNLKDWVDVPLRAELQKAFPALFIAVGHDATVAALAEHQFGAGRGANEFIYMTVSTGIGGGIISQGQIIDGILGSAGEIGHVYLDTRSDAPVCGAGHPGCLEALASGTALARDANLLLARGGAQGILAEYHAAEKDEDQVEKQANVLGSTAQTLRAKDVVAAALKGDPEAAGLVHHAATLIGYSIINLIHTLNPETIAIGGGVAHGAGDLLFNPVRSLIHDRAFKISGEAVDIVPAELGDDVGLIGAGAYVDYAAKHFG